MGWADSRGVLCEGSDYLHDESRLVGYADDLVFPENTDDVVAILKSTALPVTIQGSRTGITGACVPLGGIVMSMERMRSILGIRYEDGNYYIRLQPGVRLENLNERIINKDFDETQWSEASKMSAKKLISESRAFI